MSEDILGPDGVITIGGIDRLAVQTVGGETEIHEDFSTDMFEREIAAFAQAIREDRPVAADGEDGMIALQVSLAALRSIETGQAVTL